MNPQSPYTSGPVQPGAPMGQPQPQPQPYGQPAPFSQLPIAPSRPSKTWMIVGIVGITTTVILAGVVIWALINYFDQKTDVEGRVDSAVALAVKDQAQKDAEDYEAEKARTTQLFAGPEDYGRVSFSYRKDWSLHVAADATSGGTYTAYFNPGGVPPIRNDQQYALRVTIEEKDYEKVIDGFKSLVQKGDLKSAAVKADDNNGTRLDGAFSKDVRGSAVIFKIRDKTVTIRTDAETFKGDFDALIQTITFNK